LILASPFQFIIEPCFFCITPSTPLSAIIACAAIVCAAAFSSFTFSLRFTLHFFAIIAADCRLLSFDADIFAIDDDITLRLACHAS